MKLLFFHIHEWVYSKDRETRKCSDCGMMQWAEIVGHSLVDGPIISWDTRGVPCGACAERGTILENGEIIACPWCGGTGFVK